MEGVPPILDANLDLRKRVKRESAYNLTASSQTLASTWKHGEQQFKVLVIGSSADRENNPNIEFQTYVES